MIVVVCGVTASGKSHIARRLAELLHADILNGDAFQIYRELQIGVNKPELEIITKYNYKLIDCLDVTSSFSIADYQSLGRKIVDKSVVNNKDLVIEGGSGLYLKALLYDYNFSIKNTEYSDNYEDLSNDILYQLLKDRDIDSTNTIHINNRKRVIRALRICDDSGSKKSELVNSQKHELIYKDVVFVALNPDRKELYSKIDSRVIEMWNSGLKKEVLCIAKKYGSGLQCLQAIGYKEVLDGVSKGTSDSQIIESIQKNTRNYAKRQMTYFNHQLPVIFFKNEEELIDYIRGLKND